MIYIIITTCINNKYGIINNINRENRYSECIKQLLNLIKSDELIKPIIVENNGFRETYLNKYGCEVFYTNTNELKFIHKGVNELLDIKGVIEYYKIKDDDIIIKLTGRYKLLDLSFINTVKNNMDEYDSFIKFFNVCTKEYMVNDCVLGLFSVKCKYIKYFDYKGLKPAECEFAEHIRKKSNKIMEIAQLNLECCFADDLRLLIV